MEDGMCDGVFGMLMGFVYMFGVFVKIDEVVVLVKIVVVCGGIYDMYLCDEGNFWIGFINVVKEVLDIGW